MQYTLCFEQKIEKYQRFLSENFHFLVVKFSIYLNRRVFVMEKGRECRIKNGMKLRCPNTIGKYDKLFTQWFLCLTLCHFVLVFFSPFSIAITSHGEERAYLSVFRMFVRFVHVWICRFPLPLGVWEGLRFVIVALPGLFFLPFFILLIVLRRWSRC